MWVISLVGLSIAAASSLPHYREDCPCLLTCINRYYPQSASLSRNEDEEVRLEREACERGCLLFHDLVNDPIRHKLASQIQRHDAQHTCIHRCNSEVRVARRASACEAGCRTGCMYVISDTDVRPATVKLTIVVDHASSDAFLQDKSEIDTVLTDPALKQQIEDTQSPNDVKTKIPSSYFTNLPVPHDPHPQLCGGEEMELCEKWMIGEPIVCFALLILAAALLIIAYYTHNTQQAAALPEKLPLPPPYLPVYSKC